MLEEIGTGTPGTNEAEQAGRPSQTAAFFLALSPFSSFDAIGDTRLFTPLPDEWMIGIADVVASTAAIAKGRYKAVNTAGASVISAVSNALGTIDFPFLFAGDGASFAVAPGEAAAASEALAAAAAWVGRELGLTMRAGTVGITPLREQGLDVRVARFAASPHASYAMFSGGGLRWTERELKADRLPAPACAPQARPDLSGLSCRFQDLTSKHGVILSMLLRPASEDEDDPRFAALLADVLLIAAQGAEAGRPVPVFKALHSINPRMITMNGRLARRPGESRAASWFRSAREAATASVLLASGATVGRFSARRYLAEVVANTDFRKYDDGLMMTLDCAEAVATAIEVRLAAADREGVARAGLHRQRSATVTCVVPSPFEANHVHFVDGASGGYAMAARALVEGAASSVTATPVTS